MTVRFPHTTANVLDQALLNLCHANTTIDLRMIADIETPEGIIRVSDRNFYVGSNFYEARTTFPTIQRKIIDFLNNSPEESTLELEISNADGKFTHLLTGGTSYTLWVGNRITLKLGLRSVESSYLTIYEGFVSENKGMVRNPYSFTLTFTDKLSRLFSLLPPTSFNKETYPNIANPIVGVGVPMIYGDWSTTVINARTRNDGLHKMGTVGYVVNGLACENTFNVDVEIVFSDSPINITLPIILEKFDELYAISPLDTIITPTGVKIVQKSSNTMIGEYLDVGYFYEEDDIYYCACTRGTLEDPVSQARELMKTYGGFVDTDFTAKWDTFIALFAAGGARETKSRISILDPVSIYKYCTTLLEQVQLQMFTNLQGKIDLFSLDIEDFKYEVEQAVVKKNDMVKDSLRIYFRDSFVFNKIRTSYFYYPKRRENYYYLDPYKNTLSIDASSLTITGPTLKYPNLYLKDQVTYHAVQTLKLASSFFEEVSVGLTWRHMLQDLGNFTFQTYEVSQLVYNGSPAVVRSISYNKDYSITVVLWCLHQIPFTGWSGGAGSIGGLASVIVKDV